MFFNDHVLLVHCARIARRGFLGKGQIKFTFQLLPEHVLD